MTKYIHKTTLSKAAEKFFAYSRERYQILLNRRAGLPRNEWTNDPVMQQWSFCNIFREDDRVTIWFRDNIRQPLYHSNSVLMATVAFRWFNRINAGEELKPFLLSGNWDLRQWRNALMQRKAIDGAIVTGAYMIKTPPKLSKIDGLLQVIAQAKEQENDLISAAYGGTLEGAWTELRKCPYMGDFTSYEVVTDLRHTLLLENAPDVDWWANPGPGCAAGLGELFYKGNRKRFDRHNAEDRAYMMELMRALLECSRREEYWPQDWPAWELREVEHTLCEYDKYRRAQNGLRLKRRYKEEDGNSPLASNTLCSGRT